MPCRSAICTADPSGTVPTPSTASGTAVPSGDGVPPKGKGHPNVDAGVTFTPTAAGAYTVTPSCRRSTRCGGNYLSNSVKHLSHT